MSYLKPLDGIRAIAIIAVLIFHVMPEVLPGGFMGVDAFFVLSGFLITSGILDKIHDGCFSLKEFYLRRIQRLFPNIIITVLGVLVLWLIFFPPSTVRAIGIQAIWTLFNASNIYIWKNLGDYWGDSAKLAPLTHTWSLGIEEQFYILFPFFVLLIIRFLPKFLFLSLFALTILSFSFCFYGSYNMPQFTFYLLPTRIWELLLGSLVAVHQSRHAMEKNLCYHFKHLKSVGWLGILLLIASFLFFDVGSAFPGWVSLIPTLGTVLVLLSVLHGETALSRWLSCNVMVRTGKISYSLYLWHWPLITFGKLQADMHGFPKLAGAVVGAIGGIALAFIAYICVEQPLRQRGEGRRMRMWIITLGFVFVALFASFIAFRPCVADRYKLFNTITFSGRLYDAAGSSGSDLKTAIRYYDVFFPRDDQIIQPSWRNGGIIKSYGSGVPEVVVIGSSHALMYSRMIDSICQNLGVSVSFLGVDGGARAFFENLPSSRFKTEFEAREFDEYRQKFLRDWNPKVVFVIDRWDSIMIGKELVNVNQLEIKLRNFLEKVSPLVGLVVFVTQVPVHQVGEEVNLREIVTYSMQRKNSFPALYPDYRDNFRNDIKNRAESLVSSFNNLRILKADELFYEKSGGIRYFSDKNFFYADDDHLSDAGSEVVRSLFEEVIVEACFNQYDDKPSKN
jgi:peptidoglycan/LPS O-acetylase OafA/YrhL